jgi:hypothetical protein
MNINVEQFAALWRKNWHHKSGKAQFDQARNRIISLDDTPAYPLARTVAMPPGYHYETGALSFSLSNLEIHGIGDLDSVQCTEAVDGERIRLVLVLRCLNLRGNYALNVKPDPVITLDTGGNLMELPAKSLEPAAAGADADAPNSELDPQKEEWLEQAREQRTRLSSTENGQKLLDVHGEHNEVYDEVFRTNEAMRETWQAGGVTKLMAADTSIAVKNDSYVNDKAYTNANNETISYNSNAFTQQLALALNTLLTDPDYEFSDIASVPTEKYLAAAKAVLSFGQAVTTQTGNDKHTVQNLTPGQIYNTVNQHEGDLPPISDDDVMRLLQSGPSSGSGDEAGTIGRLVLDEADRHLLRRLFQANLQERAERSTIVGQPLFEGRCDAEIGTVSASIELNIDHSTQKPQVRGRAAQITLPAFDLNLDDSQWTGEVGRVARRRLEHLYFIRSVLRAAIAEQLQRSLLSMAETTYNALYNIA